MSDGLLTGSMNRREALRRALIVGGTMTVAAPAVQAVTAASAYAQVSPPPGPMHAISFVAFTFVCNGTYYKAKWEAETGQWEQLGAGPNGLANCGQIDHWSTATPVTGPPYNQTPMGPIQITTTPHPDDPSEIGTATITLPAGCTFDDGSAAVKGGPVGCSNPLVSGQSVTFYGNPI